MLTRKPGNDRLQSWRASDQYFQPNNIHQQRHLLANNQNRGKYTVKNNGWIKTQTLILDISFYFGQLSINYTD